MRVILSAIFLGLLGSVSIGQTISLDQGWSESDREEFYFTAQGSQLVPFEWFIALEQPDSQTLFRDNANMARYGFVTVDPTERNPEGLPIGFVRDGVDPVASGIENVATRQLEVIRETTRFEIKRAYLGKSSDASYYPREQKSWLGLTCAACHTHEIEFDNKVIRIDGGSSLADVESFLRDLGLSFQATLDDSDKLERLARRVGRSETDLKGFGKEVAQISKAVNDLVERNRGESAYGHARLDAFGAILNAVCETALDEPLNHRSANAPVSYPTLWNTPRYSFLQWNASASSAEARNVGEVLGVFATYTLEPGEQQFDSTVRLRNLIRLEHGLLTRLESPDWPTEILGTLDPEKVERGKALFAKNCVSCHAVQDPTGKFVLNDQGRIPVSSFTQAEIETDPQFLENLRLSDTALTGKLASLFNDAKQVPRPLMLSSVVKKIIGNRIKAEQITEFPPQPGTQDPPQRAGIGKGYISRPLQGIWTSAPYFHNGSVPNLFEVLLPSEKRSKTFWVGSTKFDPVKVGFRNEQTASSSQFNVLDPCDEPIVGNSNKGHEGHGQNENEGFTQTLEDGVWRDFTDSERYELIEYMKSLPANPDPNFEQVPERESELIASIVSLTAEQMRNRYQAGNQVRRGVHPKDHGCVTAKFEVLDNIPQEFALGVFQPGAVYQSVIRFSNAAVRVGPDSTKDENGQPAHGSRGMAIKLLGISGDPLMPLHGGLTQDFLMINQPAFAFANVADYELLSRVLVADNDKAGNFFKERTLHGTDAEKARMQRTLQIVQRIRANDDSAFFPAPASPVDNPYFSAAPFGLGKQLVMKYRVKPVSPSHEEPNVDDPNYLRTALEKRLESEPVEFVFSIQVRRADQIDVAKDIENASVEWPDDYVPVAKITIPKQSIDSPDKRVFCEKLFFTPWHGIQAHKPLGGINRLRRAVYLESARIRNLPKEPSSYPQTW